MRTYLGDFFNSDNNLYKYKSDDVIRWLNNTGLKVLLIAFMGNEPVLFNFDVSCLYTDKKK